MRVFRMGEKAGFKPRKSHLSGKKGTLLHLHAIIFAAAAVSLARSVLMELYYTLPLSVLPFYPPSHLLPLFYYTSCRSSMRRNATFNLIHISHHLNGINESAKMIGEFSL